VFTDSALLYFTGILQAISEISLKNKRAREAEIAYQKYYTAETARLRAELAYELQRNKDLALRVAQMKTKKPGTGPISP